MLYNSHTIRILTSRDMETKKQTDTLNSSLLALTQTAVGCGLGLLLGGKMSRQAQKTTAFTLLGVGALLALPAIVDAVSNVIAGPETERGVKKSLDSIRQDSGLPDDAEIFSAFSAFVST
jgi:ABC-type Fe3+ transport system permease subunit